MMNRLTLLHNEFDPKDSQEAQTLLEYKRQLESLRTLLLYDVDLREVKKRDIDEWERELRAIVRGISPLQNVSYIYFLLESSDGLQRCIGLVIENLYVASDILQKKSTINERQRFYRLLKECPQYLSEALEYFLI